MANFQISAITESGIQLKSHVDMGAVFTATKIVIGSGYIPTGKTAKTMTDVVSPVKELAINKKERFPDGKVVIGAVYTNEDVATEFYFRELALYAKAVYADGTEVAEVLYCYCNAAANAELMAAYSTTTVAERQLDIVTIIGNEANVDLTIESGIAMTQEHAAKMFPPLVHAHQHATGGADPITPQAIGAIPIIQANSEAYDMDVVLTSGAHFSVYATTGLTKGTPYAYGKTGFASSTIFSYGRASSYGYQIALIAGASTPMVRYLDNGTIGEWGKLYGVHYKPTADDVGALQRINAKTAAFNMDSIMKRGSHFVAYETNLDTLGTPYKYGKTTLSAAVIISYSNSENFGVQVAFISGGGIAIRYMYNGVIESWNMVYHEGNASAVVATAELV